MFILTIDKTEYTLNGMSLDRDERRQYIYSRAMGYTNPDVVIHETNILTKEFKTGKAAWAWLTPEKIDELGLYWDKTRGTYSNDYIDYSVDVRKA